MTSDRNSAKHRPFGRFPSWAIGAALACLAVASSGCTLFPDIRHKPQYHNPFPQLTRIAILPFRNQSQEPTLSGSRITQAYYSEMQGIPGFEVLPTGVVESQWAAFETHVLRRPAATAEDFQRFAQYLGCDAVLQGAITDYSPYYPPRMALKVNWYAANPGFHPIPAGYGLPWGTKEEKKIPQWVRLEAERSLAAAQLETQTPDPPSETPRLAPTPPLPNDPNLESDPMERERDADRDRDDDVRETPTFHEGNHQVNPLRTASTFRIVPQEDIGAGALASGDELPAPPQSTEHSSSMDVGSIAIETNEGEEAQGAVLPENWPDPEGFVPAKPLANKPPLIAQYEPVISHMKAYNGSDEDFTQALEEYFYFRDDARFGGWQAYLQRSEDFIRFCCHQHIVETLAARGGQLESRLILRWPLGRYER